MGITFKRHAKMTGLAGVGYSHQSVDIKLNGKKIGLIVAPTWQTPDRKWYISFNVMKLVPDENPNCDWKSIRFTERFETEDLARQYVKDNWQKIADKYKFKFIE